jgi:hypothetical protein
VPQVKRILLSLTALLCALDLHAGVVYRFESVTEGLMTQTFAGTVKAEQGNVRIDVLSGDGMFFGDGSIVLSPAGSGKVTVIDPAKRTFYEIDLSNLFGRATGALSQFKDLVKVDAKNTRVAGRDAGPAGMMLSYPVRRSHVTSSFDLILNVFGEKTPARVEINTDAWTTDKFPAEIANVFQTSTLRTGIDAIDKLIDSQTSSVRGFPLKQVTTTRVTMRGSNTLSMTISNVTSIRQSPIAPAEFAMPSGYRKVDNPVDALMKRLETPK